MHKLSDTDFFHRANYLPGGERQSVDQFDGKNHSVPLQNDSAGYEKNHQLMKCYDGSWRFWF